MERLACIWPSGTAESAHSLRESMLNQATGWPVMGSCSSRRPVVFRYSPVMDEAEKRSVSLRPAGSSPTPTLTTISSTRLCCKRPPYFETNLFMKSSKRRSSSVGSRLTRDMRWRKMRLLGTWPVLRPSLARSTSSTPCRMRDSGSTIHPSPRVSTLSWECEIMRTKMVDCLPIFFPTAEPFWVPRKTCEFRPMVGTRRLRS
mmetsp:Transcript_128297/g.357109  ORF Transcript_128297/g.357109 Transcript_128297/m.357109 type:complete len:202 (+) Transcript_128297:93-698(+)